MNRSTTRGSSTHDNKESFASKRFREVDAKLVKIDNDNKQLRDPVGENLAMMKTRNVVISEEQHFKFGSQRRCLLRHLAGFKKKFQKCHFWKKK